MRAPRKERIEGARMGKVEGSAEDRESRGLDGKTERESGVRCFATKSLFPFFLSRSRG